MSTLAVPRALRPSIIVDHRGEAIGRVLQPLHSGTQFLGAALFDNSFAVVEVLFDVVDVLFAEHVAGAEAATRTEGHGRVVSEWVLRPSRPDNHWLDCLVGCAVAASMCGVRVGVEPAEPVKRERVKLSELQQRKRVNV